jgi:hypothetical protein
MTDNEYRFDFPKQGFGELINLRDSHAPDALTFHRLSKSFSLSRLIPNSSFFLLTFCSFCYFPPFHALPREARAREDRHTRGWLQKTQPRLRSHHPAPLLHAALVLLLD